MRETSHEAFISSNSVDDRQEFSYWEIDTAVGSWGQSAFLVTLFERETRCDLILKADSKTTEAITWVLDEFKQSKTDDFGQIIKSGVTFCKLI